MDRARRQGDTPTPQDIARYRWLLGIVVVLVIMGEGFAIQVGRYQWIGGLVVVAIVVSAVPS